MNIIDNIKNRAKENIRTIVLPESMDDRVVEAGCIASNEGIANIILIGDENILKNKYTYDFSKIEIINPKTFDKTNELINKLYELRKEKGLSLEEAKELILNDNMYFACMLVKEGYADGVVSGACHSSANTLRPALQIIKTKDDVDLVSAFFLMDVPACSYGEHGVFVFADSGLVQDPNSSELASIAYSASKSFELLVQREARVAFLSHSTYGSASRDLVDKVVGAVRIAKKYYPNMVCDGELQLDAAIDMGVANKKCPDSKVAGHANTLIFPNLDAGNIGYKLVQKLAKADAYGPITQGIRKPINDLSRGCSVDDIVGVIAITSIQVED